MTCGSFLLKVHRSASKCIAQCTIGRLPAPGHHHRFLVRLHLQHIDALDTAISAIDRKVDTHVEPFRTDSPSPDHHSRGQRLERPGHPRRDRRRHEPLPVGHLISWAGLCPTNDESPTGPARGLKAHGKRRSDRMRKGLPREADRKRVGAGRTAATSVRLYARVCRLPFCDLLQHLLPDPLHQLFHHLLVRRDKPWRFWGGDATLAFCSTSFSMSISILVARKSALVDLLTIWVTIASRLVICVAFRRSSPRTAR